MILDYITQDQLLYELNISKSTLRSWIVENKLPYYKVRNKKYFRLVDIEKFLDSHHEIISD